MKKIKLVAVLLACMLLVCGCGAKNNNIKLMATTLSASNFYYLAMDEINFLTANANTIVEGTSDAVNYTLTSMLIFSGSMVATSLVSAVDFCMEVSEAESKDGTDQKIYEYYTNYAEMDANSSKLIVLVTKVQGKSNMFTSDLYSVASGTTYKDLVDGNTTPNLSNTFTISLDRASGEYSFTDTTNGISGAFSYSPDQGRMSIKISYKAELLGNQKFDMTMDIYNYLNNVLGTRILNSTTVENEKVQYIFENLSKPFTKTAKIGIVKNTNAYENMASTEESKIGVSNSGDSSGYQINYVNDSDTTQAYTTVKRYGL